MSMWIVEIVQTIAQNFSQKLGFDKDLIYFFLCAFFLGLLISFFLFIPAEMINLFAEKDKLILLKEYFIFWYFVLAGLITWFIGLIILLPLFLVVIVKIINRKFWPSIFSLIFGFLIGSITGGLLSFIFLQSTHLIIRLI